MSLLPKYEMDKNMFAPVLIPTLNRYEHFKKCLESLEKCMGACSTEVFVALDYPPSDKYKEGWKNIDKFLYAKEKSCGFKKLHVIRRTYNCGIGKPDGNYELMLKDVALKYDRFIFTEDDNEFSPNFLLYMNWGLETFQNDDNIYAICGYNKIAVPGFRSNVYACPVFNAWGCGQWFKKREKLQHYYGWDNLKQIAKSYPLSYIFSKEFQHAFHILRMIHRKELYGDSIIGCLPENERYCVYPVVSKVRNTGWDGSGLHGSRSKKEQILASARNIDESTEFMPLLIEDLYQPQLESLYIQQAFSFRWLLMTFVHRLLFLFWKLTGINIC